MPATQRLLLEIYAYGTNTGIRAIAGNAVRGHSEDDIRYLRRSPARLPGDDRGRPGRQRTIFAARYLRDRDLQSEINESLNVVESWNCANSVNFGKGGDIATNRRDEQELSVLCLRVLQAASSVSTPLMVQEVLADEEWAAQLNDPDRRSPTPLFWTHVPRTARSSST
jgi:hypothetical protein